MQLLVILRGAHQDLTVQGKSLAGVCFDMHLLAGDTWLVVFVRREPGGIRRKEEAGIKKMNA